EDTTIRVYAPAISSGEFISWATREERQRLVKIRIKSHYYSWMRHPKKPKITGYNIGISRVDFEAVNGFDENFIGWGCEDDDLAFRVRKAGCRVATALGYTHGYHLWHPSEPSRPAKQTDAAQPNPPHARERARHS